MNKFPIKLKRFKSKPNKTRASNLKRANQFLKNVNTCETWSVFRIDLTLLFITLSYLSWFEQREDDHPSFFTRTKTISDPLKTGKSASNGWSIRTTNARNAASQECLLFLKGQYQHTYLHVNCMISPRIKSVYSFYVLFSDPSKPAKSVHYHLTFLCLNTDIMVRFFTESHLQRPNPWKRPPTAVAVPGGGLPGTPTTTKPMQRKLLIYGGSRL